MDRLPSLRIVLTSAILSCVMFGLAESVTQMSPKRQNAPEGESFRLACISRRVQTNGTLYRNELYKVQESDRRVPVTKSELVMACETKHARQGNRTASITTFFTLRATEASAGTYGCVPIPVNGSLPRTFSEKDINKEVTVRVCSEPHLELSQTDADLIQVQGRENCNYKGELTWLVNGRQVPRQLAPDAASSPAIEADDDTLEIQSPEFGDVEGNTCSVTAVFTYISTDRRVSSVRETLQIADCCLPSSILPTREATTEGTNTAGALPVTFPPHPLDALANRPRQELERLALEKEVLTLEKDVLKYKLTAIPLQIKFLKRLNRDQSAGREMEKLADI